MAIINTYLSVYEGNKDQIDAYLANPSEEALTFLRPFTDETVVYNNVSVDLGCNHNTLKGLRNTFKFLITSPLEYEATKYSADREPYDDSRPTFINRVMGSFGLNTIASFESAAQKNDKITEMY